MTKEKFNYLIVPGWNGSGSEHWQSHWHRCLPNASRVEQDNWQQPQRAAWVKRLQQSIDALSKPVIIIAHSLGCITLAHWAQQADFASLQKVAGALLVAPADVERTDCPPELLNFAPINTTNLPFPSILIGSSNDPAASASRATQLAQHWGSHAHILPNAGHINIASGHTQWEQGFAWLYQLEKMALPICA